MLLRPPQFVRAPHGRRDEQRAGRLVEDREPDRDAREHGEDAEDDLRAERRVDRDRGGRAPSTLRHLAGEDDQHGDHDPRPPAVHEVEQEEVVGHREAAAPCDQSIPSGTKWPSMSGQVLET